MSSCSFSWSAEISSRDLARRTGRARRCSCSSAAILREVHARGRAGEVIVEVRVQRAVCHVRLLRPLEFVPTVGGRSACAARALLTSVPGARGLLLAATAPVRGSTRAVAGLSVTRTRSVPRGRRRRRAVRARRRRAPARSRSAASWRAGDDRRDAPSAASPCGRAPGGPADQVSSKAVAAPAGPLSTIHRSRPRSALRAPPERSVKPRTVTTRSGIARSPALRTRSTSALRWARCCSAGNETRSTATV